MLAHERMHVHCKVHCPHDRQIFSAHWASKWSSPVCGIAYASVRGFIHKRKYSYRSDNLVFTSHLDFSLHIHPSFDATLPWFFHDYIIHCSSYNSKTFTSYRGTTYLFKVSCQSGKSGFIHATQCTQLRVAYKKRKIFIPLFLPLARVKTLALQCVYHIFIEMKDENKHPFFIYIGPMLSTTLDGALSSSKSWECWRIDWVKSK